MHGDFHGSMREECLGKHDQTIRGMKLEVHDGSGTTDTDSGSDRVGKHGSLVIED